jgi:hypothetical protein
MYFIPVRFVIIILGAKNYQMLCVSLGNASSYIALYRKSALYRLPLALSARTGKKQSQRLAAS